MQNVDEWRKEERTQFSSLHFTAEGKRLRWFHPEFHMETSVGTGHVVMSVVMGSGLDFPTGTRTRDCRQVSLGKPSLLTLRRATWAGWDVMVRDRKPGPPSEVEQPWKMVKLCRISCGCCWACRKYSQCYHCSGYTHLTQKIFVFREYPCSVFVAKCRKLFIVQLV